MAGCKPAAMPVCYAPFGLRRRIRTADLSIIDRALCRPELPEGVERRLRELRALVSPCTGDRPHALQQPGRPSLRLRLVSPSFVHAASDRNWLDRARVELASSRLTVERTAGCATCQCWSTRPGSNREPHSYKECALRSLSYASNGRPGRTRTDDLPLRRRPRSSSCATGRNIHSDIFGCGGWTRTSIARSRAERPAHLNDAAIS